MYARRLAVVATVLAALMKVALFGYATRRHARGRRVWRRIGHQIKYYLPPVRTV